MCSKFFQQCKGGRPITKKKKRTPHAPKDCDRSELEMATFVPQAVSTPPPPPPKKKKKKRRSHCLLRPKQLRLYHQQLPLTRVHQIEVSQKLSKYKLHLQLNVLWTLQLLLFSAKTRQLRSPRKLSIPLTRRRIPHEADKT